MKIYNYDSETGEYIGAGYAEESPLEPGVYLIPAHATDVAPPDQKTGYARVFKSGKWSSVKDIRGKVFNKETQVPQEWTSLSPLPSHLTALEPPSVDHVFVGKAWTLDVEKRKNRLSKEVRSRRDMLLAQSDWTQIPDSPAFSMDDWRGYRQDLRDITSQDGFPESVNWPAPPSK